MSTFDIPDPLADAADMTIRNTPEAAEDARRWHVDLTHDEYERYLEGNLNRKWPSPDPDHLPYRETVLKTAAKLISGDRRAVYGSAVDNFGQTGKLWVAVLGVDYIAASQVAMCLALVKISRLTATPTHEDSWIDGCGYLALGAECAREENG